MRFFIASLLKDYNFILKISQYHSNYSSVVEQIECQQIPTISIHLILYVLNMQIITYHLSE